MLVEITSGVSDRDGLQGLKWRCGALHQSREGEIVEWSLLWRMHVKSDNKWSSC